MCERLYFSRACSKGCKGSLKGKTIIITHYAIRVTRGGKTWLYRGHCMC